MPTVEKRVPTEGEIKRGMYGCDIEQFEESVLQSFSMRVPGAGGIQMVIMSILSDAQELLAMGNAETARQYINRAKYLLMKFTQPISAQVEPKMRSHN